MITIRRSSERNTTYWLDSRYTLSFGKYYDLKHMGFSELRVINEDRVSPDGGFPTHSHRDMEIITYVPRMSARRVTLKDSFWLSVLSSAGSMARL